MTNRPWTSDATVGRRSHRAGRRRSALVSAALVAAVAGPRTGSTVFAHPPTAEDGAPWAPAIASAHADAVERMIPIARTPRTGASAAPSEATSPAPIIESTESIAARRAMVAKAVAAAERLLSGLDEAPRARVSFRFDDDAQRTRWSNLPTGMYERTGLRMGDIDETTREAVLDVLRATLSERGMRQVLDNVIGDEVLAGRARVRGAVYGDDEFYFGILGTPSTTQPWGWQFGGHHLAINATFVDGRVTLAPSLTGGRPMRFTIEDRTVSQHAREIDRAFAFVASLTAEQRAIAVRSEKHVDLAFGPTVRTVEMRPEGIRGDALDEAQRAALLALIEARVGILHSDQAAPTMARLEADLDRTTIAWFGGTNPGDVASWRIQGPTVIIEFAPQRGPDANDHVHAIYRDPTNEYGAAFLARRATEPTID